MSPAEKKSMIAGEHPALSIVRRCELLKLSRSAFYYTPVGLDEETLAIMKAIDRAFTIENNTADEILEATRDYVEEMENPGSSGIDHDLEDLWPPYSGFKLANAHLSPAYVRNYYKKRNIAAASRPLSKAS